MDAMVRTRVEDIPPIGRAEAVTLARTEYERFVELLRGLHEADWAQPTDCTRWSVKDIAAHIVGETEGFASLREFAHQFRHAARVQREIGAPTLYDGVNDVQVRERRILTPAQLIERFAASAPKATLARTRLPRPLRAVPVPLPAPLGRRPLAYLVDRVVTRDVWMHRVDIARAVSADLNITPEHDGRLAADIVADWAGTHADPFVLELGGPAGGIYRRGDSNAPVRVDAIEFIRILSGRAPGDGVMDHPLPL
jgi:uncharacterized protein (TIGR03083 family)